MAVDRVAENRKGTNQILAVESARIDRPAQTRCHRQTTLAHRARLRRTEAGTWPGTFRGPELARISPPCNLVDCSLRLPGNGTMPFSPLRQCAATPGSRHPDSHTPGAIQLQAQRRCLCGQNGITLNPLQLCDGGSQPTLPDHCLGVPAASADSYNTVVLGSNTSH